MAAGDLATLAAVKRWLGISGTNEDALLGDLITAISAMVPGVLNRGILTAPYIETRTGNGKAGFLMRNWPVKAISLVEWQGVSISNAVDLFSTSPGIAHDDRSLILIGYSMPYNQPVRITYSAGYDTVPADIAQAVVELVGEEYTSRKHIGETSHSTGGQTTVAFSREAMHKAIALKLDAWTAVAPLC